MASTPFRFSVKRQEPVLVTPAQPTPRHVLSLSNLDDQAGLRFQIPVIQFYGRNARRDGQDPRKVIRKGLERLLVHYYPFAGRVREADDSKLCVDCTAEGILFIEAEADVSLSNFGDLQPPFPCWEDLLYDVPASQAITHTPLLLVQVTVLKCGGFIFALRLNHTMSDAVGLVQLMTALGELCYGASEPSVKPVWQRRKLFPPRKPLNVSVQLHEYKQLEGDIVPFSEMSHESFVFGRREIALLKSQSGLAHRIPTFEVVSACIWRSRTRSLDMDAQQEVRLIFPLDARNRFNPPVPPGYYGNVISFACVKSTAQEICRSSLGEVASLIRQAKEAVDEEYMRSVIDMMELGGRPHFTVVGAFLISDLCKIGFEDVDLGWGRPVYGGAAQGGVGAVPGVSSFMIPRRDSRGGELQSILVPMCLPPAAMAKFRRELQQLLQIVSLL